MDNLTHTLVGAALAESGLKKRTALGAATLMIGANFPDIDVAFLALPGSIDLRRGITHGFPALVILPFVLAWLMTLYDRRVRLKRDPSATPADFKALALLAAVSIWTHPTLDFMNVYGMRWLMPFVNKWFYADGLFIVDLWILLALGFGVWASRRRNSVRPARIALIGVAAYTVANLFITGYGRSQVLDQYPGRRVMLAPIAVIPWERNVVLEDGEVYRLGNWTPQRGLELGWDLPIGRLAPEVALAKQAPSAQPFLRWSRFPYYSVRRHGDTVVVEMGDARYPGSDWAGARITTPRLP